jgi:hypothetical protein
VGHPSPPVFSWHFRLKSSGSGLSYPNGPLGNPMNDFRAAHGIHPPSPFLRLFVCNQSIMDRDTRWRIGYPDGAFSRRYLKERGVFLEPPEGRHTRPYFQYELTGGVNRKSIRELYLEWMERVSGKSRERGA